MAHSDYSFPKSDRLCSHTLINQLFAEGKSFVCYPFRVVYKNSNLPDQIHSQVLFSVSKKRFKRAVMRNLLKRRCREAYRLNREEFATFLTQNNQQITFALVYIAREELGYSVIEKGIKKTLTKLQLSLNKNSNHATD